MADERKIAGEWIKKADSKAKGGFLGVGKNHEEANEYYEKAAKAFGNAKDYKESAETWLKCASICETKLKSSEDAATYYVRAAEAYNASGDTAEALKVYRAAVRLHMNNDAFSTAAKMWKEIAKLEEKREQLGPAGDAWDKAASCHEAGNSKSSSTECYLHVARLAALQLDYKKAITLYEKVATTSQETGRGVWSASEHLYKAGLCHFVMDAKANASSRTARSEVARYCEQFNNFESARECKFLVALMDAFAANDESKFTDIIWKEDNIKKLDSWTTKMLLQVKRVLKNGPESSGPSDPAEQDDVMALLAGGSNGPPAKRSAASTTSPTSQTRGSEMKSAATATAASPTSNATQRGSATSGSGASTVRSSPTNASATTAAAPASSPTKAAPPAAAARSFDNDEDDLA